MAWSPDPRFEISMCIGDALRELAGFLDGCEDEGLVTGVGLVERDERGGSREVSAEVELTLPAPTDGSDWLALRGVSVDGEGRLGLALESTDPVVPVPEGRVEVEPVDATFDRDGTVTVTLEARVPTGDGPSDGDEAVTASEGPTTTTDGGPTAGDRRDGPTDGPADDPSTPVRGRDRDVPPFRDPELLAEVYESCDTFAEMTDAIGMDVTAETVRRYMIDYGIHQPNTYDTGSDDGDGDADDATDGASEPGAGAGAGADPDTATGPGADGGGDEGDDDAGVDPGTRTTGTTGTTGTEAPEPEAEVDDDGSPVVLADGIGLPDDVTVETLIETVKASNTLYEVERDIGVDREDALDMLRQLDLLDLVVGRLSTKDRRDIDREDVIERLREASATAARTPS